MIVAALIVPLCLATWCFALIILRSNQPLRNHSSGTLLNFSACFLRDIDSSEERECVKQHGGVSSSRAHQWDMTDSSGLDFAWIICAFRKSALTVKLNLILFTTSPEVFKHYNLHFHLHKH